MMRLRILAVCTAIMLLIGAVLPYPSMVPGYASAEPAAVTQQPQESPSESSIPEPTPEPVNTILPEQTNAPESAILSETTTPVEATPTASEEPSPTPSSTPEAAPDPLENATEGYAALLANESPIYENANKDSVKLALLSKEDVVYVSDRIFKDADHPEYDWLLCHFDSERGVIDGYLRLGQVRFLTQEEKQTFLKAFDQPKDYASFENHPLAQAACTFLAEALTAQPDLTVEPQITPSKEPTGEPTIEPTLEPTAEPTASPTTEPISTPVPVSLITLNISEAAMIAGAQRAIQAKVEPADAADSSILWASSDASIVQVDAAGNITAVSAGTAVITAAAADSSGIYAQCIITVYPPIVSFEVSGQARMQVGKPCVLTASDGGTGIANALLTWSSSDETVATVDAFGTVTGITVGSAVITATVQGSPEWRFDFPVEIIRATVITITDSNKEFSQAVSLSNSEMQSPEVSAKAFSKFSLMRLLLKTDGTIPMVDEFNPDTIIGNKDNRYIIQFTTEEETEAAYNVLATAAYVKYVTPDGIVSIVEQVKPRSAYTYHSWGAAAMHADTANESLAETKSGTIYVAIIDTGISTHTFLSGKRQAFYDYVGADNDPSDEHGHGTHVAGTVVDLTQALNVQVVAFRVLNAKGEGSDSNVLNAIYDAADAGCDIINLSLGGSYTEASYIAYRDAVSYAAARGVVVVIAAGNDASNTANYVPACLTVSGSIIIASVNSSMIYSYFSNFGTSVDMAAPGGSISSCNYIGGFTTKSGTSMAAPHISAAAAMVMLAYPSYTASQVESYLKGICTDLGPAGYDTDYGYGIPDLSALVTVTPSPKPDLAPATVISYDPSVAVGQPIFFDTGVANSGDADAGSFAVKWEVNGVQMGYGLHNSIAANTTVMDGNSSFYWTPDSPGSYTVAFTVDCDGAISEEDETNNSVSVTVVVPDPAKPDLSPTEITYNSSTAAVGHLLDFDSGVVNLGNTDSGSFAVKWEVNGMQASYGLHDNVAAHTTMLYGNSSFTWVPPASGTYTITFTVDCDNSVTEENETNNAISVTVIVPEAKIPDLAPTDITCSSSNVSVGNTVFFETGVINSGDGDSGYFSVKWEVDGIQTSYGTHIPVAAYTTKMDDNSYFVWTPSSPGYHTITFTVDSDATIGEKNESNNQTSVTVYVNPAGPPPPQSVTINLSYIVIGVGQGVSVLSASVLPAGSNPAITWTSSNSNVATVTSDGYVYGTGVGTTLVRAVAVNGLYADCSVNVFKSGGIVAISLNKSNIAMDEGKAYKLKVAFVPKRPAFSAVRWSSSNPSVATVDSKGSVFGAAPGTAVITATASSGLIAQCTVTINSLAVSQVNLSKTYLEVYEGKTASISASVLPKNARVKTVTWSSSDPAIASVSPRGKITTYQPGTVQIIATANNGVASACTLVVRSLAVTSVALSKSAITLPLGRSSTLRAALLPANARYKAVTWVSSNEAVAVVTAKGKVIAVGHGTATITAIAHNGIMASCIVTVP